MSQRLIFLLLVLSVVAVPVSAGVVYEIEVKDHTQSPPKSESIQAAVEGRHLKMGIASQGDDQGGEMIFRGDRREIVVVDHKDKSYFVIDRQMAQNIGGQVSSALEQARKAMENIPEDQRALVEKMLQEHMPQQAPVVPKAEIRKTREKGTHLDNAMALYEVWIDGRKEDELWITAWDDIVGGKETANVFLEMSEFYGELLDSFGELGSGPSFGQRDLFFEHLTEVGGFPVISRDFDDDGSLESESTLRSARRMALDPDAFEPPSGYKRQEMFAPGN